MRFVKELVLPFVCSFLFVGILGFSAWRLGVNRRTTRLEDIGHRIVAVETELQSLADEYNKRLDGFNDDSEALAAIRVNIQLTDETISSAIAVRRKMDPVYPDGSNYTDNLAVYEYLTDRAGSLNKLTKKELQEYDENLKNSPK